MTAPTPIQSNQGSQLTTVGDPSFEVTLPTVTTAGTTLVLCLITGPTLVPDAPAGFEPLATVGGTATKHHWYRRANVPAGETAWTVDGIADWFHLWKIWEYNGLHPTAPLVSQGDFGPVTGQRTSLSTGHSGASDAVDTLCLAAHSWSNSVAAPSQTVGFSGHTNGFVEDAEVDLVGGDIHARASFSSKTTVGELGAFETTAAVTHSAPHAADTYTGSLVTLQSDATMPAVVSRRVDYSDATSYSDPAPPTRTSDVLGVVYWHANPYRTLVYGQDFYLVDGVSLEGAAISDEAFEVYRLALHAEEHPGALPDAGPAPTRIGGTSASLTGQASYNIPVAAHLTGDVIVGAIRIGNAAITSISPVNGAAWHYTAHVLPDLSVFLLMWLRALADQPTSVDFTLVLSTARAVRYTTGVWRGVGDDPVGFAAIATGTSATPDPPLVTLDAPANAAFCACVTTPAAHTVTTPPAGYTTIASGAGNLVSLAQKAVDGASGDNPDVFTLAAAQAWAAATIGLPGT